MSVHVSCDYCGEVIDGEHATITVAGRFPADEGSRYYNFTLGHYHTESDDSEPACCWRIHEAIKLTESLGPSLEQIPTITGQAVAARRRKHRKGGES